MKRYEKIAMLEKQSGRFADASIQMQGILREIFSLPSIDKEDISNEEFTIEKKSIIPNTYLKFSFLKSEKYITCLTCNSTSNNLEVGQMSVKNLLRLLIINGFTEEDCENFLLPFYGDGTLDGNGGKTLKTSEIREKYAKEINSFNKQANNVSTSIINSIMFRMPNGSMIDGILLIGQFNKMLYVSRHDIENYIQKKDMPKARKLSVTTNRA